MIRQTYVTAFIAACLVAGSQAGPCKPSSRTTEGLTDTTSDAPTTLGSTTVSSFGETTAVASSSTYLSNEESSIVITESVSSTETSVDPRETSTTALLTTEDTTTEAASTTVTTTASEATSAIPFISNTGFDDDDSSVAPWELYYDEFAVSIASGVKHDGPNSALVAKTLGARLLIDYIRQPLQGSITAGVTYTMSAWVNANSLCPAVTLICSYQSNAWTDATPIDLTSSVDQWNLDDIPSLAGKVALVTGANTPDGIGYHIAHQLALKGAKVYIGARNLQKATKAIRTMLAESPQLKPESLVPFAVDMGNFKQVQFAARKVVAEEPRLDILVNNAAVIARPLDKDGNGISVSFGINHLGPFLLTRELLPLLNKTQAEHPGVRIVNVASTAHYDVPTGAKFGSLEDFNNAYGSENEPLANYLRYGYSKLATILHTKELQRRFDQEGVDILALSVHPGGVATDGAAGYLGGRDNDVFRSNLSPFEGAITPLFAAAHPEPAQHRDKYAGSFIMPFGGLKEPTEDANNAELAKQLWTTSEQVDFAFSFVGGPFAWHWPLAFQAAFALWVIFVVFGVPESPRWLLNHGKRQEAIEVLSTVYDNPIDHPDIPREVHSMETALSIEAEAARSTSLASTFRKDKVSTRYRVFLAWYVQFMNQTGAVLTANIELEHRLAQIIAGCIQLMFPIDSLLPTLALDKMGRLSTMIWGSAGLSFSVMMVAALLSQVDDISRGRAFAARSVAFFFTYMLVFGASMNCVPSNWLWNSKVVMITPVLINRLQWKAYLIFMATNLIFVPIIFVLYPETSNLVLEEVDNIFARGENIVQVARDMQKELALYELLADDYPEKATKVESKPHEKGDEFVEHAQA
ncbi:light induced alcohol dehydrogenase Bli-4 [Fusarium subglutinans]|uniref:Light induced alcohol dehydrogenase Bli-4 n=1 Tax=Gibberella subglutinans TaxID=42677 RepID=A0A8H5QCV5_GIBSU|nr:light induced alcohol dehydrogenase Bli-4 [Fusarium subglutinans]KAF5611693.1 light induced alcohol dehydrogenase Bli-4 [Fusarium subglutinans]